MTVQQCKYVLGIAETGSFNEAAKRLFVAQSSLSLSIKSLEDELGIKIFDRTDGGVCLTEDGTEFVQYARRMTEQHNFIIERFKRNDGGDHLYVSTQHYDFVADIFAKMMNETASDSFHLALREMKTYDILKETETAFCDIGIIAIKRADAAIMKRYLGKHGLEFTMIREAKPHIFIKKDHPLAGNEKVSAEMLKDLPYVSYEQGKHNISFFSEEIFAPGGSKQVEISDRASLLNILLATDSYTVGTGIMPSLLNGGRIISIPFESNGSYLIGFIMRKDRNPSPLTKRFIEIMKEELED